MTMTSRTPSSGRMLQGAEVVGGLGQFVLAEDLDAVLCEQSRGDAHAGDGHTGEGSVVDPVVAAGGAALLEDGHPYPVTPRGFARQRGAPYEELGDVGAGGGARPRGAGQHGRAVRRSRRRRGRLSHDLRGRAWDGQATGDLRAERYEPA